MILLQVIGFMAMIVVSLYVTVIAYGFGIATLLLDGNKKDKLFLVCLIMSAVVMWFCSYCLSPFQISFKG